MNEEWYKAWLRPDCMLGAATNTRIAMAKNQPISDRFKNRLRKCMNEDDFDRLMQGDHRFTHTANVRGEEAGLDRSTSSERGRLRRPLPSPSPSRSIPDGRSNRRRTSAGPAAPSRVQTDPSISSLTVDSRRRRSRSREVSNSVARHVEETGRAPMVQEELDRVEELVSRVQDPSSAPARRRRPPPGPKRAEKMDMDGGLRATYGIYKEMYDEAWALPQSAETRKELRDIAGNIDQLLEIETGNMYAATLRKYKQLRDKCQFTGESAQVASVGPPSSDVEMDPLDLLRAEAEAVLGRRHPAADSLQRVYREIKDVPELKPLYRRLRKAYANARSREATAQAEAAYEENDEPEAEEER